MADAVDQATDTLIDWIVQQHDHGLALRTATSLLAAVEQLRATSRTGTDYLTAAALGRQFWLQAMREGSTLAQVKWLRDLSDALGRAGAASVGVYELELAGLVPDSPSGAT